MRLDCPRCSAYAVFFCVVLLALPNAALAIGEAESENGEYSIEAIGSGRFTGAYLRFPDVPELYQRQDDGLSASVARLMLDGSLGERVDYEVNIFVDLTRTPPSTMGGAFATAGSFDSPYRYKHLSAEFWDSGSVDGSLGLDRVNIIAELGKVSLSAGRMPVNYSVTRMFAPLDFFAPFSTTAINTVYKPGVDTVRLGVATGMLSTMELVGVMGSDPDDVPTWGRSALVLHLRTVRWNYEWAVLGGKLAERWITGASFQGEAGPVGIRAEGYVGFPDTRGEGGLDDLDGDGKKNDGIHTRLAAGFDIPFEWHNASIGAEYMYLSDGTGSASGYLARATRFFPDDLMFLGRHYAGLSVGGEIIPILQIMTMGLLNAEDYSGLAVITLIYSVSDESELSGGAMIPWGAKPSASDDPLATLQSIESEFGLMPLTVFLETRFYF